MREPTTLRRVLGATFHYGLASYLPRIVNFALLPVLAVYLPPDEMGILEIGVALQVLMYSGSRLGLPGALSRLYFEHRQGDRYKDLCATIAAGDLVASLLGLGVVLLFGPMIFSRWITEVPFHPYMTLAATAGFLGFIPELQARLLQATEQSKVAASFTVSMSILGTVLKVFFVIGIRWGVLGVLWGELIGASIAAVVAIVWHRNDLRGRFRWPILKDALHYGLPLVPHGMGAWAQDYGGRWVLGIFGALAAVGQLGLASRIVSPIQIGAGAFVAAFAPVYFSWRTDLSEERALGEVRKTSVAALTTACVAAIGAGSLGALTIRVFNHFNLLTAYAEVASILGILAAALLSRVVYNITGVELLFSKATKAISLIFIVGAVATVGLTAILAPRYGVIGAALAQLGGTVLSVVLTVVVAVRLFPSAVSARLGVAVVFAGIAACVSPALLPGGALAIDAAVAILSFGVFTLVTLILAGFSKSSVQRVIALRRGRLKEAES
jgi:O-antigen/teichoic acid export membrane protein